MSKKGVQIFFPLLAKLQALPKPVHRPITPRSCISYLSSSHPSVPSSRAFNTSTITMSNLETILTKDACPRKPRATPSHLPFLLSPSIPLTLPSGGPLQPSHQSRRTDLGRRANPRRHDRRFDRRQHRREDSAMLQEPQGHPRGGRQRRQQNRARGRFLDGYEGTSI